MSFPSITYSSPMHRNASQDLLVCPLISTDKWSRIESQWFFFRMVPDNSYRYYIGEYLDKCPYLQDIRTTIRLRIRRGKMVTNSRQHAAQLGDAAPARDHGGVAVEGVGGGGEAHRGVDAGGRECHHQDFISFGGLSQ